MQQHPVLNRRTALADQTRDFTRFAEPRGVSVHAACSACGPATRNARLIEGGCTRVRAWPGRQRVRSQRGEVLQAPERSAISSVECSPALVPAHHRDGARVTSFAHMPVEQTLAATWRSSILTGQSHVGLVLFLGWRHVGAVAMPWVPSISVMVRFGLAAGEAIRSCSTPSDRRPHIASRPSTRRSLMPAGCSSSPTAPGSGIDLGEGVDGVVREEAVGHGGQELGLCFRLETARSLANQVELVVHVVTRVRLSGRSRPGSRRSGGAGTGSSSACA